MLFVSNGYGEAAIAAIIARALGERCATEQAHLWLVGDPPPAAWPDPVGPHAAMPSGGLIAYGNLRNLTRDVGAGLIGLTLAQWRYLARQRARTCVVAVGDVYCAAACMLFARRPTIFVATAKSERVAPHSRFECAVARRARVVFARDEPTAAALRDRGVNARFVGNAMMDALRDGGEDPFAPAAPDALRVAILPGSRSDAPRNATDGVRRAARLAALLAPREVVAAVSVAPTVDERAMLEALTPSAPLPDRAAFRATLASGSFGALLRHADLAFGQAGTANEQAAGAGLPVLAALDAGERAERLTWYRMRQRALLGDALLVLPSDDDAFVRGAAAVARDERLRERMAAAGRERMGPPGGAAAIAAAIAEIAAQ